MLLHFIHFKGRGIFILIAPMLVGSGLFVLFSETGVNDVYIRDFTLILSSVILFFLDNKRESINEGVIQKSSKRITGVHQLMWIDMNYWAIAMGAIGTILFLIDLKKLGF